MTTETLKNPSVPTIPNPIGVDLVIAQLQASLATLTWLQKSFGRAQTMPRTVLGQKRIEPMVYQGTQEYYPVMPNDSLKSYSFWRVNGPRVTVDYEANMNTGGRFYFKDQADLIVWIDLKNNDPSKDFVYTELLIQDVLVKLNRDPNVAVVRVWDDKAEDIFKGYTLFENHRDLLMYPYAAFRIETILSYQFQCQP